MKDFEMELVSIIVPVYNMEKSLENAMQSILLQSYKNIEVILVDDGSKDDSLSVCYKLKKQDERVKVIHTDNQGSGPARNVGIDASIGKYLYFPDADDYLDPNAISVLVKTMEESRCDLVVFGYRTLNHNGEILLEKKYEYFENLGDDIRANYSEYLGMDKEHSIQGAPWNKFFDGDIVRTKSVRYPSLRRHQDEGFISRYVTCCSKVVFIPGVLYTYYANTVSLEWKKYPVDYVDAVVGLNQVWQETICLWNPADKKTHMLVEKEIFSKLIKSLELSYSPKMSFNYCERLKWVKNVCKKTDISHYRMNVAGSLYQRCVLICTKIKFYNILMFGLYIGTLKNHVRQG